MSSVFLVSDTHFSHAGVCRFLRADGTKLRPFDNPDEMDEYMVKAWNETVKENDLVIHLGDVAMNEKGLNVVSRLNGRKKLICGNHETLKLEKYTKHFEDIKSYHEVDRILLSHIPVHPSQKFRYRGNIHGHLHDKELPDPFYYNVCVEHTGYKPILLEKVLKEFKYRIDFWQEEIIYDY